MAATHSPLSWLQRQLASRTQRRIFEEERLVAHATEQILEALKSSGMAKAELAELLETSRPNVTQLLDGRRNLTIRTLARIAFELGHRIEFDLLPLAGTEIAPIEVTASSEYWAPEVVSYVKAQSTLADDQIDLLSSSNVNVDIVSCINVTGEYSLAALAA